MNNPTSHEVIAHLAEHYGVTTAAAQALCRIPTHPRELRDEFASRALTGAMSRGWRNPTDVAKEVYAAVDAMMEARNANR